mgnify:FL=1
MNIPKVFIIILNWNGLQDTLECLESVYKLEYSNFEVVVVDNGSSDDSVKVIRNAYPQVTLIENDKNLGFTGGNNIAMRYAMRHGCDYMWLLNNDTIVESDALCKIITAAEKSLDIGLVSPVIYYYDKPDKIQFCGCYIDWKDLSISSVSDIVILDQVCKERQISLWGTALLIKRCIIEQVGYLNEKYFAYYEDYEYSTRVANADYRNIVQREAKVYHKGSGSTSGQESPIQVFLRTRNLYFFWMDNLKGLRKINYFKKYIAHTILYATSLNNNLPESADACFNGAWAAIRGIGGPWDKSASMSGSLKKVFYFICSWHPYFLTALLQGDFLNIISKTFKRVKAKYLNTSD